MTSTSAQLRQLASIETAYVLVIDGCPVVWSTTADIAGTDYLSGRTVRAGLRLPRYGYGLDVSIGTLEQDEASFEIDDIDGDLVSLFATEREGVAVSPVTITPLDDLSSETDLHGKQVGIEAIGSSGERHQYPAILDFAIGLEHVGDDGGRSDIPAAVVSDDPLLWAGRRVVLYQIYRDHITYPDRSTGVTSWLPLTDADRVWWGTLRDAGQARHREWSLRCDGPSSWLRKPLGLLSQSEGELVADAAVAFLDGEDKVAIALSQFAFNYFGLGSGYSGFGESAYTQTAADGQFSSIATAVNAALTEALAATGPDGEFADEGNAAASFDTSTAIFQVRGPQYTDLDVETRIVVIMHEKAWRVLGYDPQVQTHASRFNAYGFPIDNKSVSFIPAATFAFDVAGPTPAPAAGYWAASFNTHKIQGEHTFDFDNGGNVRVYEPLYTSGGTSGTVTLLADLSAGPQEIYLPLHGIYHRGQLDRPVAADPDDSTSPLAITDVGDADAQGLWVFFGPRVDAAAPETVVEYVQVARCSWVREGGGAFVSVGGDPTPTIAVTEWLDPRDFGFPHERMTSDWLGARYGEPDDRIQCMPLHALMHRATGLDDAVTVLQRLLASTGTATGWYTTTGYSTPAYGAGTAYLEAGENDPGFSGPARDAEYADLGLAIPVDMLAAQVEWDRVREAIDSDGPELGRVRAAFLAGTPAEEVINGIIEPLGLSLSLRGGAYGLMSFADDLSQSVDASIGETDVLWEGDRMPTQEIRAYQPIDRVEIEWNMNPVSGEYQHSYAFASRDRGARYRPGGIVRQLQAPSMRTTRPVMPNGMLARWARISRFWERRHFWVRDYPVLRTAALDLWPGSIVRITDARLVSQAGEYGVTGFLGIVTRVSVDASGPPVKRLDLLVHASSAVSRRYHAPVAKGIGWDPSTNRIYCEDDFLGLADGTLDVSDFIEPSWSSVGGSASIKWYQWDGAGWSETGQGTVSSVSAVAGACYIQLSGAPSGAYYKSRDTLIVMREHANQSADWVKAIYAPVCDEDGEFDSTAGYRFQDA